MTTLLATIPPCLTILVIFFAWNKARCKHKWVKEAHGNIVNSDGWKTGDYYVLQCEKCGKMKTENLK